MAFTKTNKAESFEVTKSPKGTKVASINELQPLEKDKNDEEKSG